MTDRVIRIVVDTGGTSARLNQLEGRLERLERQKRRTRQSANALRQAFVGLIGVLGAREVAQAADQYTLIGNRIRLVTDSTQELNAVQDRLIGIAQRTRTDLSATAELYGRVARSVEDLNTTQDENLRFTEAVSQAIQISGATAQEAAASSIQFAQGLASGALRGDELRSVLEQNSRLAEVLAEGFDTNIGGLRRLGEQGELTAERIFEAVLQAGPELQREFELINPTVSQTLTTIRNFATVVVGSFNEAVGVTEGLNQIFGLTEDQTVSLAATVRDLGLSFREFVEVATVAVANFAETVPTRFAQLRADIAGTLGVIFGNDEVVEAAIADRAEFIRTIEEIQSKLDDEFAAIQRNNEERRAALEQRDADLERRDREGGIGGAGTVDPDAAKAAQDREKFLADLLLQEEALAIAAETGREYQEVLEDLQLVQLAAGDEAFQFDAQETIDEIRRLKEVLDEQRAAAQLEDERRERARQITEDVATEQERYNAALAELEGLLADGLITPETFERAKDGLNDLDDATEDFFRRARENSQDILAGFLENGLQDLDEFGREFGNLILRLASQALAADIFNLLLGQQGGGGQGGLIQAGLSFLGGGRQFGGGVIGGQAVRTGEGGRFGSEVFVPNVGGTVVPATSGAGGAAAMAPPVVNVTNVNTLDPSEIVGAFNEGEGDQVLLNRISTKPTAFRRALGIGTGVQ